MLKIWLALFLSLSASVMVLIAGFVHGTRLAVVFSRMLGTAVCLGGIGALLGALYERKLLPYLVKNASAAVPDQEERKEAPEDAPPGGAEEDGADSGAEKKEPGFAPFTTENFKRVLPPDH